MKIICVGEMLIDFTPGGKPLTYTANPGGAPANVAVCVSRCGGRAAFLGRVGDDDFGRLLSGVLDRENVERLCPEPCREASTTLAFVTLNEKGDRSFTFVRKPGADMLLSVEDAEKADFSGCTILHVGSVSQTAEPSRSAVLAAVRRAKKMGALVSFDINYRPAIWSKEQCRKECDEIFPHVDLLKISEEELCFVGGMESLPDFMVRHSVSVAAVTLGPKGAVIFFDGGRIEIDAISTEAVDTTGAGDAFWGAFLCSLAEQGIASISDLTAERIEQAGKYGAAAAGLCVRKKGGIPSLPYRDEIENILKGELL